MSIRLKTCLAVLLVLALAGGCGRVEPTATSQLTAKPTQPPVRSTNTTLPAAETAAPAPKVTPLPTTIATPLAVVTEQTMPVPSSEPLVSVEFKTFGGSGSDLAYGVLLTADGGTLVSGLANREQLHGHGSLSGTARLIRTDSGGEPMWDRDYGGELPAAFFAMIQAADGECVLLGERVSPDNGDNADLYLVQVDDEGREIWSHTYGSSSVETGRGVQQTADGGYILIGTTTSVRETDASIYLVKTDAQGNEVWSRAYGDQWLHLGWGVIQMPDGGYIFSGFSAPDHDARDILAMKIDAAGDVEWSRTWDYGGLDEGFGITLAPDGNAVIVGVASLGSPTSRIVLLKVDPQGNEIWSKTIGKTGAAAWHVTAMPDGGYMLGGRIGSAALMLKTDEEGQVIWQHTFGAEEFENAFVGPVVLLPDGGYLFVGGATRHGQENPDMLWLEID